MMFIFSINQNLMTKYFLYIGSENCSLYNVALPSLAYLAAILSLSFTSDLQIRDLLCQYNVRHRSGHWPQLGQKKFPDMITLHCSNQSSFSFDPDFWIMNILFQAIKLLNIF